MENDPKDECRFFGGSMEGETQRINRRFNVYMFNISTQATVDGWKEAQEILDAKLQSGEVTQETFEQE